DIARALAARLLADPAVPVKALRIPFSDPIFDFVIAQKTDGARELPKELADFLPCSAEDKRLIAAAWRYCPECPALDDRGLRTSFVEWLMDAPGTLGACLLASAARGDTETVHQLGPQWRDKGWGETGAPEILLAAAGIPTLRTFVWEALDGWLPWFHKAPAALSCLMEGASRIDHFGAMAAIGYFLEARGAAESSQKPEVERRQAALHILALVMTGAVEQAAERYRRRWIRTGLPYPWPERILLPLQGIGATDIEKHLGESGALAETQEAWAKLTDQRLKKRLDPDFIRECGERLGTTDDPVLLTALTEAVLAVRRLQRVEPEIISALRDHWNSRPNQDNSAPAYRILLAQKPGDAIQMFLAITEPDPSDPLIRRAFVTAVEAARSLRRWNDLHRLKEWKAVKDGKLHAFLSRELFEFADNITELYRVNTGNSSESSREIACRWERLLALPLKPYDMLSAIKVFVERHHKKRLESLARDIELQLLRRAHVIAAQAVAQSSLNDYERINEIQRLARADGLNQVADVLAGVEHF
ncbi:MAG: hypothetical protein K2Q10_10005, partial [Rhodospirillales bacterium]|nr:hypothetical protein [Rhodospirillales bacterium]